YKDVGVGLALGLDPDRVRQQTIDTVSRLLLKASTKHPIVLFIEDLHWVDPSTLDFLDQLLPRLASTRILLLMTTRSGFVHTWTPHESVLLLPLAPLGDANAKAIVGHVCRSRTLPDDVVRVIVGRTDGVPLFLEELTKTVLESRVRSSSDSGSPSTGVPAS